MENILESYLNLIWISFDNYITDGDFWFSMEIIR